MEKLKSYRRFSLKMFLYYHNISSSITYTLKLSFF